MILYIKSAGRNDKSFTIERNGKKNEIKVKKDIHQELKEYLKKEGITLEDFGEFIPIPTESFTGYRQAVNICNTLKHFVLGVQVEELEYPQYHKDPNITKPKNPF